MNQKHVMFYFKSAFSNKTCTIKSTKHPNKKKSEKKSNGKPVVISHSCLSPSRLSTIYFVFTMHNLLSGLFQKNESDEDDEEMPKMKETTTSNEKYHLEMKQLRYGSINCNDIPFLPQKDTVANVNELEEGGLQNLK